MRRDHPAKGALGERLASLWQQCKHKARVGNAVDGGGLHKGSVHRLHGLATILSVMPVRRARHGIATLHRLLRCCGAAVKCVGRESDCERHEKNWLGQTHHGPS
jgi:hypothetical protein